VKEFHWHGFRELMISGGVMSSNIRRIVVPTDFTDASDRAVAYAAALARRLGASLYVIHALTDHTDYETARVTLAEIAARLTEGVRRVAVETRIGGAAESIVEAARHYGADLIVMATHGRAGLSHAIAGSIAEDVIRTGCCPVLVLRDSGNVRVHRRAAAPRGLVGAA
jgi:universal stress protein A